jgi:hypothetical protein
MKQGLNGDLTYSLWMRADLRSPVRFAFQARDVSVRFGNSVPPVWMSVRSERPPLDCTLGRSSLQDGADSFYIVGF